MAIISKDSNGAQIEVTNIPVTGEYFLRYLRVGDNIYLALYSVITHKDLMVSFGIDIEKIEDAGFVAVLDEGLPILVSDRSNTLNIGKPGSEERKETVRLISEATGQDAIEPKKRN